jgi:sulfide:quinone oxidoreductase
MTLHNRYSGPFKVVIAGGGVAALEAAFALREHAGAAVDLTLLAPAPDFVYRPMTVQEPFAYAPAQSYALDEIARDLEAQLVHDAFAWVEPARQVAHTAEGEELPYDAMILALGARAYPRYRHALTVDDRRMDETLHGLIQDIEGRYVRSLAFVVPPRMAWPLPIYELALMTAGRAYDLSLETSVTLVTPEDAPLAIFGVEASTTVAALLEESGVTTITSSYAEVPAAGEVVMFPGDRRQKFDRVVALPELFGPTVRGLPAAERGFIPIDVHGKVRGVKHVYAAGDATDFAVKHGGIAAQQADAAAEAIAALTGIPIHPKPFDPVIHGMLLTGGEPKYLTARIAGGHGFSSTISDTPTWSPPRKIAAKYLAPYLDRHDRREHAVGAANLARARA